MRVYEVRLSSLLKAKVVRHDGDVLDLVRDIKRGRWMKDTDGEYLNPAHVITVKLGAKS